MEIGIVGLGKMGANMASRLLKNGHEVVVFDRNPGKVDAAVEEGARGVESLEQFAGKLQPPRAVWVMVPAGDPTESIVSQLGVILEPGDVVIDGGNSYYKDSLRRAVELEEHGVLFVDVGVSGGIWGKTAGYGLMVGGEEDVVARLRPFFESLAPAPDRGWSRVGGSGAGHFVKMVHNGIEYGLMEAYAEGFALLKAKEEFDFDLRQIADTWRFGTVIRSWLLDLTARALADDQDLTQVAAYVEDSGEGRWTVLEAVHLAVPAPVISEALFARFRSRRPDNYSDRLLAALRREFGGHAVHKGET
jgi:6-phosphogluconate dehydrogenase